MINHLFKIIMLLTLSSTAMAASITKYDPLCTDFAQKLILDKAQHVNEMTLKRRNVSSNDNSLKVKKFLELPVVISKKLDLLFLKEIGKKKAVSKKAKNFNDTMMAEENAIKKMNSYLLTQAPQFLKSCGNVYTAVYAKCDKFLKVKKFNEYSSCVNTSINKTSNYVASFVPFAKYISKFERKISSLESLTVLVK